jgi:hypothetical protein
VSQCSICQKATQHNTSICTDCLEKMRNDETVLLVDPDETVLLEETEKLNNDSIVDETLLLTNEIGSSKITSNKLSHTDKVKTKKIPTTGHTRQKKNRFAYSLMGMAIILLGSYLFMINKPNTEESAITPAENKDAPMEELTMKELPEEYKSLENTALINPHLQKDQILSFFGYSLVMNKTSPDEVKEMFQQREYEEFTSGDEYSMVYSTIPEIDEIFLDFKRNQLVRITILSTSGEEIDVHTGNDAYLGQTLEQVLAQYGNKSLSSSLKNRLEYVDFASKMYVIFEDIPDHQDGKIDYLFVEKYDRALPHAVTSFEKEKMEFEGIQ